jgi:hypothetical protein
MKRKIDLLKMKNSVYIIINDDGDMIVASLSEDEMLDSFILFMEEELDMEVNKEDLSIEYNSYLDGGVILIKNQMIQNFVKVQLFNKK